MSDIRVICKEDWNNVSVSMKAVIEEIEKSMHLLASGCLKNPPKLCIDTPVRGLAIAMLSGSGRTGSSQIKSYFEFGKRHPKYGKGLSLVSLFNEAWDPPVILMDGSWITSVRSAAVTALMVSHLSKRNAKRAVLIGLGHIGQAIIQALMEFCPLLEEYYIYARSAASIDRAHCLRMKEESKTVRIISSMEELGHCCKKSDVIIASASAEAMYLVPYSWLAEGALAVLVGYGLHKDIAHNADRVIATSEAQMHITGLEFAYEDGTFPKVDAELHDIISGQMPGRLSEWDKIFAYNSGLAANDQIVAEMLADIVLRHDFGLQLSLFGGVPVRSGSGSR